MSHAGEPNKTSLEDVAEEAEPEIGADQVSGKFKTFRSFSDQYADPDNHNLLSESPLCRIMFLPSVTDRDLSPTRSTFASSPFTITP